MTHEQGLTGDDQPRAPGESVNETAADGREEVSVVEEAKDGGSMPGKPEPPAKPSSPSTGGGKSETANPGPPPGGPPQQMQAAQPVGAPRPPGGDPRSSTGSAPSPVSGPRPPRPPQPPRPVGPPPAAQQQPTRTVVNHPPASLLCGCPWEPRGLLLRPDLWARRHLRMVPGRPGNGEAGRRRRELPTRRRKPGTSSGNWG